MVLVNVVRFTMSSKFKPLEDYQRPHYQFCFYDIGKNIYILLG